MGLTQYFVAATVDGYIADENDRLDWLMQFGFEGFQKHFDGFIAGIGAIVMGSRTYDYILGEGVDAWTYGATPTWVLTTRELERFPDADIRFTSDDVRAIHRDALDAAAGKNVWVVGGGNVAAQLLDLGLLDELHLTVMPVILGAGRPLLPVSSVHGPIELLRTTPFDRGAVEHVYRLTRPGG